MKIPRWRARGYSYLPDLLRNRGKILEFIKENIGDLLGLSNTVDKGAIIIDHNTTWRETTQAGLTTVSRVSGSADLWLNNTANNESQLNIGRNPLELGYPSGGTNGIFPGRFNLVDYFPGSFKYFDPGAVGVDDAGTGVIIKYGLGTTVSGGLYYLSATATWTLTDASSATKGRDQLLAIALGTSPTTHGMLIKGYIRLGTYAANTPWDVGSPVYMADSSGEDGGTSTTKPTTSGDTIRVIGYVLSKSGVNFNATSGVILFDPDGSYTTV